MKFTICSLRILLIYSPRLDCSFPSSDFPLGTLSKLPSQHQSASQTMLGRRSNQPPCFGGLALSPTCTVLRPRLLSLHFFVLSGLPAAANVCLCPKCLPERGRPTQKCRQSGCLNSPAFHIPPLFISSFLDRYITTSLLTHSIACVKSNTHGHSSSSSAGSWNWELC